MRVMMALLLGLYLVVPARAADGGPVLLLPGLSSPTAEAAPGYRCADFLEEAGLRPEGLEYLFCRPATEPRTGRRTLTARYRVPGPQAAAVETALRERTGMAALDSLKMKEISYIHSEAYAAGELKHGTISLIEEGTPVIGILTQDSLYEKMVSNLVEVKSRGAYLCGITDYGNYTIEDTVDFTTYLPRIDDHFAASLAVIPLQLLGYYVSVARGLDVDKPRNLAKSVTVE